jgi:hypothetical protein
MLEEVLNLSEKEKLLSVSLLWNWWQERNRGNHGESYQSVDSFQYNVRRHVDEWVTYLRKKDEVHTSLTHKWEAPPDEFIKLNVDAAFREDSLSGGWGVVGRDNKSELCLAATGPLYMISDAMHAETIALANAIQIADQLGMGRVIF